MEGVASEAASLAGHLALGKLIVLYDDNKVTLAGSADVAFTEDVRERFEAYGWQTILVGPNEANDVEALDQAIKVAKADTAAPEPDRGPLDDRLRLARGRHVQDPRRAAGQGEPGQRPASGWAGATGPSRCRTRSTPSGASAPRPAPSCTPPGTPPTRPGRRPNPDLAATFERARDGALPENLPWPAFTAENGSIASREAGGTVMNAIAAALPELVGGSADLDPSTKTYLKGQGDFQPSSYAGRNIHFGVREHAMGATIERDRAPRRAAAVRGDLLQLRRLPQARAAPGGHQQDPRDLRLHPRLGVPGRGRPDAPADRAARHAARDAQRHGRAPGRRARDAGGVEADDPAQDRALGADPQPPEAAVPGRAQRRRRARRLRAATSRPAGPT